MTVIAAIIISTYFYRILYWDHMHSVINFGLVYYLSMLNVYEMYVTGEYVLLAFHECHIC